MSQLSGKALKWASAVWGNDSQVTHQMVTLELRVGLFHTETVILFITSASLNPVILGYHWLHLHDPLLSWQFKEYLHWSPRCQEQCFKTNLSLPC